MCGTTPNEVQLVFLVMVTSEDTASSAIQKDLSLGYSISDQHI
jgi:hypothetical protein